MVELGFPEAGHTARPVYQRRQRAELCGIMRMAAFVSVTHQARLLQHNEMLRYDRLRNSSLGRQRANSLFTFAAETLEEGAPRGIGQGSKERVLGLRHPEFIPRWL